MTAPGASTAGFVRAAWLSFATLLLASCAEQQPKPQPAPAAPQTGPSQPSSKKPWKPLGPYTPGGLYAPGVSDGAPDVPPDIARLPEPVPHPEPLSHYGNRSPYAVLGKTYTILPSAAGYVERGMASWYGTKFDGRVTSSFEPYDLTQFTAAHRTLPLPCFARVTNLENGRSVIVRINDRGPFHEGRLIDLSYAAAIKLGVNVHGTAMVEVRGIDTGQPLPPVPADMAAGKPAATHAVAVVPKPVLAKPVLTKPVLTKPAVAKTEQAAGPTSPSVTTTAAPAPATSFAPPAATSAAPSVVADATAVPAAPTSAAAAQPVPAPTGEPSSAADAQSAIAPPAAEAPAAVTAAPAPVPLPAPTTPAATTAPSFTDVLAPVASAAAPIASAAEATVSALSKVPSTVIAPRVAPATSAVPGAAPFGRADIDPSTMGFLQIASFGDRDKAEKMLQRLQQAGIEHAELVSVEVANQTWWRLHIGPMRADEAERVAAHLDDLGFGTPPFFKE